MNTIPACPSCRAPLRLTGLVERDFVARKSGFADGFIASLAGEMVVWAVIAAVTMLLVAMGLPEAAAWPMATLAIVLLLLIALLKPWQFVPGEAVAERGHWVCPRCHGHYQGRALREIAPPLPDQRAGDPAI